MFVQRYMLEIYVHYRSDGIEESTHFTIYDTFCEIKDEMKIVKYKIIPYNGESEIHELRKKYEAKVIALNRAYDDDQVYISEIGNYIDQIILVNDSEVWFVEQAGTLT